MKIVFLIINYMPHQLASIKAVIDYYGAEVTVFVNEDNDTKNSDIKNWVSIPMVGLTRENLLATILQINPQMLVVAGWAIKDFVWVSKQIKSQSKIPTIAYSDTQWDNTIRQKINCLISPWHLKKAFSHLWVAGFYQFEYARKLGYAKRNIIFGSLSCDIEIFGEINSRTAAKYPKTMLFVGRFVKVKGLDLLLDAWDILEDKKGWQLVLVGDGPAVPDVANKPDIILKSFMSQHELLTEFQNAGCFVFPSKWDPWAVVIHEAVASGLPIIATNVCGAAPHFVISGYNGYQIDPNVESIKSAMQSMIEKSDDELVEFGNRSRMLSKSITPQISAANLMSLLTNINR